MKESFKTIKKHFIESFKEISDDPKFIEKVCVWTMTIFTLAFGVSAVGVPIALNSNNGVSGLVFLSYIITIPILIVLINAVANWFVKIYQE